MTKGGLQSKSIRKASRHHFERGIASTLQFASSPIDIDYQVVNGYLGKCLSQYTRSSSKLLNPLVATSLSNYTDTLSSKSPENPLVSSSHGNVLQSPAIALPFSIHRSTRASRIVRHRWSPPLQPVFFRNNNVPIREKYTCFHTALRPRSSRPPIKCPEYREADNSCQHGEDRFVMTDGPDPSIAYSTASYAVYDASLGSWIMIPPKSQSRVLASREYVTRNFPSTSSMMAPVSALMMCCPDESSDETRRLDVHLAVLQQQRRHTFMQLCHFMTSFKLRVDGDDCLPRKLDTYMDMAETLNWSAAI